MPIYDYRCTQCGKRFELMRSISNRDDVTCPECGGRVTRVFEGRWCVGIRKGDAGGCSGNCAGCKGCGG